MRRLRQCFRSDVGQVLVRRNIDELKLSGEDFLPDLVLSDVDVFCPFVDPVVGCDRNSACKVSTQGARDGETKILESFLYLLKLSACEREGEVFSFRRRGCHTVLFACAPGDSAVTYPNDVSTERSSCVQACSVVRVRVHFEEQLAVSRES